MEKQQAKEAERVAKQQAVVYTMRMMDMLNAFGDEVRESFKTGSQGAVVSRGCMLGCG